MKIPAYNPPWLFAPLAAPSGIASWGVTALLVPYLLRKHGVAVDRIAIVSATASIPTFCFFLWAPVVDIGLRRRTWILLIYGCAALCLALAIRGSSGSLTRLTIFLFASSVIESLGRSAVGAVMTTLSPDVRGRASGWHQVGNIGAGALGGGACVWLADRIGLPFLSAAVAALVFLPALAAFRLAEIPHPRMAASRLFPALARDIWKVLWSWRALVGMVFFCSPVGAGAVGNLISALGPDYRASNAVVAWVSGAGGSVMLGIGSLTGGFVCDRLNRLTVYALSGLIAAACGAYLALAPGTPFTFSAGYAGYALSTGLAFTAFSALVLDVLGHGRRAAATGSSLLTSVGNLPVSYMTWLDGVGYKHAGALGLMGVDALANGGGGLLLLLLAWFCASRWSAPAAAPLSGESQAEEGRQITAQINIAGA
jgi:MFS transporter, PAT family, beta-lactamase induction signal transducer AmpG